MQVQYNNAGALAGAANFVFNNATGYVGIGTTSPSTALQVNGTVTANAINDSNANSGYVTTTSTTCGGKYCFFYPANGTLQSQTMNAICKQAGYAAWLGVNSNAVTGGAATNYYSGNYPNGSWVGGSGGGCTSSCYWITQVSCLSL